MSGRIGKKIENVLTLCRELLIGKTLVKKDLKTRFEISPRTLERYIVFIEDILQLRIKKSSQLVNGRNIRTYSLDKSLKVDDTKLSAEQKVALNMSKNLLRSYQPGLESVISDVIETSDDTQVFGTKGTYSVVTPNQANMAAEEVAEWGRISNAIETRHAIEFQYHNKKRGVEPYALFMVQKAWYFVGYEIAAGKIKTFKLGKAEQISLSPQRIQRKLDFDLVSRFEASFGIYFDGEVEKVDLKVASKWVAVLVDKFPHPSIQTVDLGDDYTKVSYMVNDLYSFSEKATFLL